MYTPIIAPIVLVKIDRGEKNETPKNEGKYPPMIDPMIRPNITKVFSDILVLELYNFSKGFFIGFKS